MGVDGPEFWPRIRIADGRGAETGPAGWERAGADFADYTGVV